MDLNKDGVISLDEFMDSCRKVMYSYFHLHETKRLNIIKKTIFNIHEHTQTTKNHIFL